jgi:hypothetical protein
MRPVWNPEPGIRSSYSDRTSGCCAGSWQLRMLPVPDARPFMPLCLTSRHGEFLRQTGTPTAHLKEIMPVTGRVSTDPARAVRLCFTVNFPGANCWPPGAVGLNMTCDTSGRNGNACDLPSALDFRCRLYPIESTAFEPVYRLRRR